MRAQISNVQPNSLPQLFYGQSGDIDVSFFTDLWTATGLPNRDLKALIGPKKFTGASEEDRIRALGHLCENDEWRKRWFDQVEASRKRVTPSLPQIADLYAKRRLPKLDIHGDTFPSFFRKEYDGKIYPQLEKIGELVDFLAECFLLDPTATATFTWALLEKAQRTRGKGISEKETALRQFPEALIAALRERGEFKLVELLTPLHFVHAGISGASSPSLKATAARRVPITVDGTQSQRASGQFRRRDSRIASLRDDLAALYSRAEFEVSTKQRALAAMCAELTEEKTRPILIAQRMQAKLEELSTFAASAENEQRSIASKISQWLENLVILKPLRSEWTALPEVFGTTGAMGIANTICHDLETFSSLDSRLSVIPTDVLNRFRPRILDAMEGGRSASTLAVEAVLHEAERYAVDQAERQSAFKYVAAVAQDADWVATDDPAMEPYWPTLAAMSVADEPLLDITWLAFRQAFSHAYPEILHAARTVLEPLWPRDIVAVVRCLSLLSPVQLERLATDAPDLETPITLTQAFGFLAAAKSRDDRKFEYWSSQPLSKYAKVASDEQHPLMDRLLAAIFSESTIEDGSGTVAELESIAREQDRSSDDTQSDGDLAEWVDLDHLLKFRAHGSGHYASLWRAAHKDCIEPLQRYTKPARPAECARNILNELDRIDVDARYAQWLRLSQASIVSESQYEAATKVYVGGRLEKIRSWCLHNQELVVRKKMSRHSIRDILSSSAESTGEREILCTWIKQVAMDLAGKTIAVPVLRSDEQDAQFGLGLPATIFMPRSYLNHLAGTPVSWKRFLTDRLAGVADACSPPALWSFYRAAGSLEAQENLRDIRPEALSDVDGRALDQELELYGIKLAVRISDLRTKLSAFTASDEIHRLQRQIALYFDEKRWTRCASTIEQASLLAKLLEDKKLEDEKRETLGRDIRALGGNWSDQDSIPQLVERFAQLYEDSAGRRAHVTVLKNFADTRNLASPLVDAATDAASALSSPQRLPSMDDSAFLAEAWGSFLAPISEQLKRPRTLPPANKRLLEVLASNVLFAMSKESASGHSNPALLDACIDCAPLLETAESVGDLRALIAKFSGQAGMVQLAEVLEMNDFAGEEEERASPSQDSPAIPERPEQNEPNGHDAVEASVSGRSIHAVITWARQYASDPPTSTTDFRAVMTRRSWQDGLNASINAIENEEQLRLDETSQSRDAFLTAVICAANIPGSLTAPEAPYAVGMLAMCQDSRPMQWLQSEKGRLGGSLIADFVGSILLGWAGRDGADLGNAKKDARNVVGSAIRDLGDLRLGASVPSREAAALFASTPAEGSQAGFILRAIWDVFTGDKNQADIRAGLMQMLFKTGLFSHLGFCFTLAPIEMERRVAHAYAQLLRNSDSVRGREALENIRSASQSKPFVSFAQAILASLTRNQGLPAEIVFAAPLEKGATRRSWLGVLTITPRAINPPLDIEVELPADGTISFASGSRKMLFDGPFFEQTDERIELVIDAADVRSTTIHIRCIFTTLERKRVTADIQLALEVAGYEPFETVTEEQLDTAFNSFPQFQMRGHDYVVRDADEKRIETTLFSRDRAGSLWISSPRRSGKTTMLFRILDQYSHKVGRDNAVIFLSMDKGFQSVSDFNAWVWSRVQSNYENDALRRLTIDFSRIGEGLDFNVSADIFLSTLAREILARNKTLTRVYFLFDEIDKLAEMSLAEGEARQVATELTWHFRHILSSQPTIGMVFCGSNPARTIFVRSPEAALYNSISNFELTPFGASTDLDKQRSREVVEPGALRGRYKFPDKTLGFLLKVTAGIPYYMKLVAGATYAVAQQTYLMQSDVINGLKALLEKSTGITALDSLDDPGEDELRVLYSRKERDQLLIRAVLYAAADIKSPVSAGPLMVGDLRSERSPLVSRYSMSKSEISAGLESAIQLGYLRRLKDIPAVEFSIPMLGESIRARSGALWAIINDRLEQWTTQ